MEISYFHCVFSAVGRNLELIVFESLFFFGRKKFYFNFPLIKLIRFRIARFDALQSVGKSSIPAESAPTATALLTTARFVFGTTAALCFLEVNLQSNFTALHLGQILTVDLLVDLVYQVSLKDA